MEGAHAGVKVLRGGLCNQPCPIGSKASCRTQQQLWPSKIGLRMVWTSSTQRCKGATVGLTRWLWGTSDNAHSQHHVLQPTAQWAQNKCGLGSAHSFPGAHIPKARGSFPTMPLQLAAAPKPPHPEPSAGCPSHTGRHCFRNFPRQV